ncbi:Sulfotransferase 17 [Theobroma cacao]|uniref:Sulfotransferase n=1 Tax=Theobroma cacao TaxID=3641 RepID=A0A061EZ67_THECC|nr:Sulfotransferase 17 [Theobroma cacao]
MSLFAIATRKLFDNSSSPLLTKNPHLCVPSFEGYGQKADIREPGVPLIATHTPYTCLPKSVLDCSPDHCKIVYICRDAFVSLFHYAAKRRPTENEPISLEVAFHLFCEGKSFFGPCWDHILEYWKASQERPDKVMFLKYEDMLNDSVLYVKKLAEFMGYPFSSDEEQVGAVQKIVDLCSFENLSNLEINKTGKRYADDSEATNKYFFRKGKIGDWQNYLTSCRNVRVQEPDHQTRVKTLKNEKSPPIFFTRYD